MKNNIFVSLVISLILTFFFLFLKLFNFNEWGELLSVFYLGFLWFVFMFIALSFLKKHFPNDFPTFKVDLEKAEKTFFKKASETDNLDTESYTDIEDKIDINFTSEEPKRNSEVSKKFQENKEKKNSKSKKNYVPGELDASSFNFEPKKMANAVRSMLNKD